MASPWAARMGGFDTNPEQYDRVRPPYPVMLYDDLLESVALSADSIVLEIGCGPGTFTAPLADRGCAIHALEPGPELARYAARKLSRYQNVAIVPGTFEEY